MTRSPYLVDIDLIDLEPTRSNDDRKFEVLASNIAQQGGLLHPLVLRQNGDRFIVVEGVRRLKALRWISATHAPCRFVAGKTAEEALLSMIEQRHTLGLDDFTIAAALDRAVYRYHISLEDVATWADAERRELLNAYTLLVRATPALCKAVHDGWVTPGQAVQLAACAPQRQRQYLKNIYTGTQEVSDGSQRGRRLLRRPNEGRRFGAQSTGQRSIQEAGRAGQ